MGETIHTSWTASQPINRHLHGLDDFYGKERSTRFFVCPLAQLTGIPWTKRGEDLYKVFVKQAPPSQPSPLPYNTDKRSSPADSALGRDVLQTASSPVGKHCSCFKLKHLGWYKSNPKGRHFLTCYFSFRKICANLTLRKGCVLLKFCTVVPKRSGGLVLVREQCPPTSSLLLLSKF